MRAHEMRELTDQELNTELDESYRELLNLRFRIATKQLANSSQIRVTRKNLARLNTVIRERQAVEK